MILYLFCFSPQQQLRQPHKDDCEYDYIPPASPSPLTPVFAQRRQNRQRRDYLYRRALLLRDAEISEKRAKLRESLATGKPLDRAIANDEQLRKDLAYDETSADTKDQLDLDDECMFDS